MNFITPVQLAPYLRRTVREKNISFIPQRTCPLCYTLLGYRVMHHRIFFDGNCPCLGREVPLVEKQWNDMASWVLIQTNPLDRAKVAKRFGLTPKEMMARGLIPGYTPEFLHSLGCQPSQAQQARVRSPLRINHAKNAEEKAKRLAKQKGAA